MGDQILQARDVSRGDGLDGRSVVDRAAVGPVQPKPSVADAAGNVDEMRPSGVGTRGRSAILRVEAECCVGAGIDLAEIVEADLGFGRRQAVIAAEPAQDAVTDPPMRYGPQLLLHAFERTARI